MVILSICQISRLFLALPQVICIGALLCYDSLFESVLAQTVMIGAATEMEPAQLIQYTSHGFEIEAKVGPPGEPVAIKVKLPLVIAGQKGEPTTPRFLIFRGLPNQFSFSSGFRIRQSWVVSVKDLDRLQLVYPPNFAGTLQLEAVVHGPEGVPLLNSVLAVQINASVIKPSQAHETAAIQGANPGGRPEPPNRPGKPKWDGAEQARLLERGQSFMGTGNIAAARMILEQLAEQGNAKAAFAMGQSYDPDFLRRMNVIGSLPDAAQVRKWYLRAAELGSEQANARLSILAE